MASGDTSVLIPHQPLREFVTKAFERVGVPSDEAWIMADTMVEADLRGVHSHGVMRTPVYVQRVQTKATAAKADWKIVAESESTANIDGGNGLGQVVGVRAMELAIKKARAVGSSVVGVRNSNHYGAAAYFAMMALPEDMIGFSTTVGGANIMAPTGGITPLLGNNPFAIAVPAGEEYPPVLDMANSVVARGKIVLAMKKGERIPDGWAMNKEGVPTNDAKEAFEGLVLPVGGYKGYGMAFMVAALAGVLTGAAVGSEVTNFYGDFARPQNTGHLMMAIRIDRFLPVAEFKAKMDAFIREIKSSELAKGADRVYLPGEIEALKKQERLQTGVPVPQAVLRELHELADALGIARLDA